MQAITKVFSDIVKPYIDTVKQTLTNQTKQNGAVNIIKSLSPVGNGDFTYTIDKDKVFTFTSTSTTTGGGITIGTVDLKAGQQYYLAGGYSANCRVDLRKDSTMWIDNTESKQVISTAYSPYVTFIPNNDTTVDVVIRIQDNTVLNDVKVYPMVMLKNGLEFSGNIATDYLPPSETNVQLSRETTGLIDNQNINGAVNMLPTDIATQVFEGATITHNSDGSYSVVKSTADSQTNSILSTAFTLKAGTYYWCASQNGHSAIGSNDCYCFIKGINGTGDWYRSTDFDVNHKWGVITLTQDSSIQFGIIVGTGTSNITFYPMISVASYDGDYVPYAKSNKELTDVLSQKFAVVTGTLINGNVTTTAPTGFTAENSVVISCMVKITDSRWYSAANGMIDTTQNNCAIYPHVWWDGNTGLRVINYYSDYVGRPYKICLMRTDI